MYLWLKLCLNVGSLDFEMSRQEFSGQRPWSWCQRSSREDAAALHWGQQFLRSRKLISKQFWWFLLGQQVLQPTVTWKISVSVSQRTEDAAEARTSGSVSPADFFSQTPKEISNFQIPVSCGKIPQFIMCLKTKILTLSAFLLTWFCIFKNVMKYWSWVNDSWLLYSVKIPMV